MKRLSFEVRVTRTFTIEGGSYSECWEVFKRELNLLDTRGKWEMPLKFDRGRMPNGLFVDEQLSEHVKMREFTLHHGMEIYATHDECPKCFCDDTLRFDFTADGLGYLDPMAECSNCGYKQLFCNEARGSRKCVTCLHRVDCLIKEDELE